MNLEETVLQYADNRMNHERARRFGAPVLRSLSPDAIFMGYSVTNDRGADVIVETNHVLRSSLSSGLPTGFTTRTFKTWNNPNQEHAFHALSHLMNNRPEWQELGETQEGRDELLMMIESLPTTEISVSVDSAVHTALASPFEDATFAFLYDPVSGALISIAAPTPVFAEEFTTRVDE